MRFVSQPLQPDVDTMDASRMAAGEPGFPGRFRQGDRVFEVEAILEKSREYGNCRHGSGERYLRRYVYRVRVTDGSILKILFHRSFDRPKGRGISRWWLQSIEEAGDGH